MKFLSASIFLSLMSCVSALEKPSSRLESLHSERHLQKLMELDQGFAKLQKDTEERDLQLGSGMFCQKQLDACLTYTDGASLELWPTYLAPMQNGTVPLDSLGPILFIINIFTTVGIVLGDALGLETLTNILTIIDTVLAFLSNLMSRFRQMAFEEIVTAMIELEQQTSEVFAGSEAAWDQFAALQNEAFVIMQETVDRASSRGSAAVASTYEVVSSFLNFYAELYRSIIAVGLGPTSQSVADCQTARVTCAFDRLAIDTVPVLTTLVLFMSSEVATSVPIATIAPVVTNATDAPVETDETESP